MLTILEIIIPIVLLLVTTFVVVFVGVVHHKVNNLSDYYLNVLLVAGPILLSTMCFWLMSAFAFWPYYFTIITTVTIFVGLVFIASGIGINLFTGDDNYWLVPVGAFIIFMFFCIVMPVAVL